MTIMLLTAVFLLMLLLPFFIAGNVMTFGERQTLQIRYDNKRDPRFFAKSFRKKMKTALDAAAGSDTVMLSREERLYRGIPDADIVDRIVFCEKSAACDKPKNFDKEILALQNLELASGTVLRAVAGMADVVLGDQTDLIRWADAEHLLHFGKGCSLGISASSGHILEIEEDSEFFRLFAPEIRIGTVGSPVVCSVMEKHSENGGICRTKNVEDNEFVETDIISEDKLGIGYNAVITGSVKAYGDIHVKKGARIIGNLVSDGTIALEEGVYVGGVIFSESSVLIGDNCQIGRTYTLKSVVAKNTVTLCCGARIFGYVSCEHGGKTVSREEYSKLLAAGY